MKKLLGGLKVLRQLDDTSKNAMNKEVAHIATRAIIDCTRVIVAEIVANKSVYKITNGVIDLADELCEEFLSEKVVIHAETVKLEHKAETTETKETANNANNSDELETITVPSTQVG